MDALSEALRGVSVAGALIFNAEKSAPWGTRSPSISAAGGRLGSGSDHLILFHLVTSGTARARVGKLEVPLSAGELVVLPRGDAHELWNGKVARWVDGASLLPKILSGNLELESGGGGGARTTFVCGYLGVDRATERLVLNGLPPIFKVALRGDEDGTWLESTLLRAVKQKRNVLRTRLAETMLLETLSRYGDSTGWLAAARDDVTGRALAALHARPCARLVVAEPGESRGDVSLGAQPTLRALRRRASTHLPRATAPAARGTCVANE